MDELAREYHDTHDPEIPEEIFELARRLREMDQDSRSVSMRQGFVLDFGRGPRLFPRFHRVVFQSVLL